MWTPAAPWRWQAPSWLFPSTFSTRPTSFHGSHPWPPSSGINQRTKEVQDLRGDTVNRARRARRDLLIVFFQQKSDGFTAAERDGSTISYRDDDTAMNNKDQV
ncbi:hypothetical protein J5N97_014067 [Dioscorea zingiberensis]|uniref:Uncharacterized protein n=1 Tax=Dioscorea zingiberensis TaxID=325984 RepID=A0A9D5CUE6_9LILI|nr:hypothetical protein J5N97_014067 [Dioscorea zingiberensis]